MLMGRISLRVPRCNARRGLNQGSSSKMIEAGSLRCLHLCVIAQDWTIELLTEVHAVDYMQESMNGIMRVGMLSALPV